MDLLHDEIIRRWQKGGKWDLLGGKRSNVLGSFIWPWLLARHEVRKVLYHKLLLP
jgi:hypothetical protein